MFNKPHQRAVEHFVPVAVGTTYYNDATNKDLFNSNLNLNLAVGQVGVFSANGEGSLAPNKSLSTSAFNIDAAPSIYIASGRNVTQKSPLPQIQYWRSHTINASDRTKATFKAYAAPTHEVWMLSNVQALDNTQYTIKIGYTGRRHDEMYSCVRRNASSHSFVTPDYTTLGTAVPVDHLLQNLAFEINRTAYDVRKIGNKSIGTFPVIALALTTGHATPSADGTLINNLPSGGNFTIATTSAGNWTVYITPEMKQSIINAATAAGLNPANDAVLTINLSTAGTTTNGTAEAIMLVGTDWPLALEDEVPQVKVSIRPTLVAGFTDTASLSKFEDAFEGSGVGRVINLMFYATQAQRLHNLNYFDPVDPKIDSPFTDDGKYDLLVIESVAKETPGVTGEVAFPRATYVVIENGYDSSTLRSNLDTWLSSASMPNIDTN